MKSVKPWSKNEECPEEGFKEFKSALLRASFHNAGPNSEMSFASKETYSAAELAIKYDWPFWVIERMFNEIDPLVSWHTFMQNYINALKLM